MEVLVAQEQARLGAAWWFVKWQLLFKSKFLRRSMCFVRCYVTGLPLHLRQCFIDKDIDALDSSLDGVDEATAMASVRAAAALNSMTVLRRLHGRLGRAALKHQDSNGQSALHWACMFDSADCVRYLLQHAPESATIRDVDGNGVAIVEPEILGNMLFCGCMYRA